MVAGRQAPPTRATVSRRSLQGVRGHCLHEAVEFAGDIRHFAGSRIADERCGGGARRAVLQLEVLVHTYMQKLTDFL